MQNSGDINLNSSIENDLFPPFLTKTPNKFLDDTVEKLKNRIGGNFTEKIDLNGAHENQILEMLQESPSDQSSGSTKLLEESNPEKLLEETVSPNDLGSVEHNDGMSLFKQGMTT